jgi:hypothetical protein
MFDIKPSLNPKQLTFFIFKLVITGAFGAMIDFIVDTLQPLASVTTTVYIPGVIFVKKLDVVGDPLFKVYE